jgi:hypothetical protein
MIKRWANWHPEHGYDIKPPQYGHLDPNLINEWLKNESLPRRSISPGLHSGLTVLINIQQEEYYCSSSESRAA